MKYFGMSDEPKYLIGDEYLPMAKMYWGVWPLPKGAKIIGGFSDDHRAGALIELASSNWTCGNAGAHSNVYKKRAGRPEDMTGEKRRNVYLDDAIWAKAVELGKGSASDGIRVALASFARKEINKILTGEKQ
jgi:hypothetical protein